MINEGEEMKLFENEMVDFNHLKNNNLSNSDIDVINSKYLKGDVRIVTEQARYPLNTIVSLVDSNNYNLKPEFQRRHRWDPKRKSRLIESFIMNVPIPPIFLYEVKYSSYEVMDGLQRLTAIYQFYKDEYQLDGLEEWKEINGLTYSQLPDLIKRGIDRRYLSSIILLQETAKNVEEAQRMKQLVFERLNSGGVDLEPQETRNALYDGPLNRLCIKLARNNYFCKMWCIPEPTENEDIKKGVISDKLRKNSIFSKMEDVELVLRFFAYRQIEKWETLTIKQFLDYFLIKGNCFEEELLVKYENLYNKTIELVYNIFGEKAFYLRRKREKQEKWYWFNRPTKVIYDPLMQVISQYIDKEELLISRKQEICAGISDLYEEYYSFFNGRSNNRNDVIRRIQILDNHLRLYIEG